MILFWSTYAFLPPALAEPLLQLLTSNFPSVTAQFLGTHSLDGTILRNYIVLFRLVDASLSHYPDPLRVLIQR